MIIQVKIRTYKVPGHQSFPATDDSQEMTYEHIQEYIILTEKNMINLDD